MSQNKKTKELILNKGSERYVFRYTEGCEDALLDALVDNAKAVETDFDWFDAAVLSFRLTRNLISEADEILHKDVPNLSKNFDGQGFVS